MLKLLEAKVESQILCGYDLWCPKCDFRSAIWTVGNPTPRILDRCREEQYQVAFRKHAYHGTVTLIREWEKDVPQV